MIRRSQFARRLTALPVRGPVALLLAVSLAGCHHKTLRQPFPLAAVAPVPLETSELPDSLLEIATLPPPELEPPSPPPPPKPVSRPRPAPKEEPKSPQQAANEVESAALAIGALSTGGDAAPQSQQEAQGLIASILKQIAALPSRTADTQKKQVRQIKNFLDQAQKALNSGDADGAKNLATKAKLLMDDLEKK